MPVETHLFGWIGRMNLNWGNTTIRATMDPTCPLKALEVGWRSSCTQALGSDAKPHYVGGVPPKKKNKKASCMQKLYIES